MARTASIMIPLGSVAPAFSLPDASGKMVSLSEFGGAPVLLVAFICNHCPFVKHIATEFAGLVCEYQPRGVAAVAINSNDAASYPDDSPEKMLAESRQRGYSFPYLVDETQGVAKAYRAACTPDFFVFDGDRRLLYRGQMDDSRPGNGLPVTGADLRTALDAALVRGAPLAMQKPSIGCNIKWRPGNEPDYYG